MKYKITNMKFFIYTKIYNVKNTFKTKNLQIWVSFQIKNHHFNKDFITSFNCKV